MLCSTSLSFDGIVYLLVYFEIEWHVWLNSGASLSCAHLYFYFMYFMFESISVCMCVCVIFFFFLRLWHVGLSSKDGLVFSCTFNILFSSIKNDRWIIYNGKSYWRILNLRKKTTLHRFYFLLSNRKKGNRDWIYSGNGQ